MAINQASVLVGDLRSRRRWDRKANARTNPKDDRKCAINQFIYIQGVFPDIVDLNIIRKCCFSLKQKIAEFRRIPVQILYVGYLWRLIPYPQEKMPFSWSMLFFEPYVVYRDTFRILGGIHILYGYGV
jgi:hypothetical protein